MNVFLNLSIRRMLFILFLVITIPFLVVTLYSTNENREEAMENARQRTLQLVKSIVEEQRVQVSGTKQLLSTLARLPEFQQGKVEKCTEILSDLSKQNSMYANLLYTDAQGNAIASAYPFKPFSVKHRKYFQDVLKTKDFSSGEYAVAMVANKPVFHYAHPVMDRKNALKGILIAAVDLDHYENLFKNSSLPPGSNLAITDYKGVRLFRYPLVKETVGHNDLPDMMAFMSGPDEAGTFLNIGVDGVKRLYGYSRIRLRDQDPPYMFIRAGIPEEVALAGANEILKRNILIIGLTVLVSILFAGYLGKILFVRRLEQLNTFAKRVQDGEIESCTDIPHTRDELGELARSFDSMAKSLIEKEGAKNGMLKALREGEEKYRSLFETSTQGILIYDHDGTIQMINPSMMCLLGAEIPEKIIGRTYLDFIHPDDREESMARIEKLFLLSQNISNNVNNSQVSVPVREHRMIMINGDAVTVESTGVAFQHQGSIYIQGNFRNITKRKQADVARSESERRLADIIDFLPDATLAIDKDKRVIIWNRGIEEMTGIPAEEMLGNGEHAYSIPFYGVARPQLMDLFWEPEHEIAAKYPILKREGENFVVEAFCPALYNGRGAFIWAKASPLRDSEGKLIGAIECVRDITDIKQAEKRLREVRELEKGILQSVPHGLFGVERRRIFFANDAMEAVFGWKPEELIGKSTRIIFRTDEEWLEYGDILYQRLEKEPLAVFEWDKPFVRKDGSEFFCHMSVSRIAAELGEQRRIVATFEDITDRKLAEEQLKSTLESLRKSFGATVQVLVSAVESRDPYTSGHQFRSADLARAIATEMGLPRERIEGIRMAGSIHDIGKMSVPAEILVKPIKLSDLELSLIKDHAQRGFEMLKDVDSPWPLAEIVYQHHERIDGSGYPRNLKGDDILMEARILAVADVVEAMASHRPYRPAIGLNEALAEIENNKGTLYDADAVDACLRLYREKNFQFEGARL